MEKKNTRKKYGKAMKCPVCECGLRAIQYAGENGTKTPTIPRKYCVNCDKIYKILLEEE